MKSAKAEAASGKQNPAWKYVAITAMVMLVLLASGFWATLSYKENVNKYGFPYGAFSNGNVTVVFEKDGTAVYQSKAENWRVQVKYAINGDLYTEMMFYYPNTPKIPASYYWEYDGNELRFRLWGTDDNAHRKQVMTGSPYKRIKQAP